MKNDYWRKFGLIGLLRLLTGIAQFILILLITSALSLRDVGYYTIFTIHLNYAAQFATLSFHSYFIRIISVIDKNEIGSKLFQIWAAILTTTAVTIICLQFLNWIGFVQIPEMLLFCIILVLTAFNLQHENFLVAVRAPIMATALLLLKNSWIYLAIALQYAGLIDLSLDLVFKFWIAGEATVATIILLYLGKRRMLPRSIERIDISWIRNGLVSSIKYTIIGFLFLLSISSQRLILSPYAGEQNVGIFHFFYVISVFGPNLLEATIYAVLLPKIIRSAQEAGNVLLAPRWQITAFMLLSSIVGLGILYMMLPYALYILGKPELIDHIGIVETTICYALIYTVSRSFHYQLYAVGADNWILGSYALSAFVAGITSYILIPSYGITGASTSLVLTSFAMLVALCIPFVMPLRLSLARREHTP